MLILEGVPVDVIQGVQRQEKMQLSRDVPAGAILIIFPLICRPHVGGYRIPPRTRIKSIQHTPKKFWRGGIESSRDGSDVK